MSSAPPINDLHISPPTSTFTSTQPGSQQQHSFLTNPSYRHNTAQTTLSRAKFHEVTDLLLANPNLNSSHLFRADILYDSAGLLKTKAQHEAGLTATTGTGYSNSDDGEAGPRAEPLDEGPPEGPGPSLNGVEPYRTVMRDLIPRNTNLDRSLKQSCYLYNLDHEREAVVYVPQVSSVKEMPWYHPAIRALAYVFEPETTNGEAALSVWYLPFDDEATTVAPEVPQRLHRTLLALGSTFLRLARYQGPTSSHNSSNTDGTTADIPSSSKGSVDGDIDLRPSALKDNILPQHIVQDTYARLKTTYAPFLISKWVEATPPEKHVFEDLAIAAFLVCLWREMYGDPQAATGLRFQGFVDLACGNGLLVYILSEEGWTGWGIDARRRKTWEALGLEDRGAVREGVVVPKPFVDALGDAVVGVDEQGDARLTESGMAVHNGVFEPGTFIISNHADELTVWTPLLAALSNPENPLPFLAIPCCSHALSGEKYRYTPKDASLWKSIPLATQDETHQKQEQQTVTTKAPGPEQGSLLALRATHQRERERERTSENGSGGPGGEDKSAYGCLTRKTVQVARRLGIMTTCTLMRIPSTRNVGVVSCPGMGSRTGGGGGGDLDVKREQMDAENDLKDLAGAGGEKQRENPKKQRRRTETIEDIVEQECLRSGGVEKSAEIWVERARKIHVGQGRGKVNWGGKRGEVARKEGALSGRDGGEEGTTNKNGRIGDEDKGK